MPFAEITTSLSRGFGEPPSTATQKQKAFCEIWRVLRPGGRLQLGDIVLDAAISREARRDVGLWTD